MSENTNDVDAANSEGEPAPEVPMNRAERRAAAKNKGGAQHQQFGHNSGGGSRPQVGKPVGGAGQVKMPRRTGGA